MPKFYVTDGVNTFLIDTNTHIQACKKAIIYWQNKNKSIGQKLCYNNVGFKTNVEDDCIEVKLIKGLDLDYE